MEQVFLIIELIGTVAFSISGAMIAIEKKMDIFGVAILGVMTALGGGITRDLILGNTPPQMFRNPIYAAVAVAVALIFFIPAVRRILNKRPRTNEITLLIMDSLGLGIFTVIGIKTAILSGHQENGFLLVFVGVITGVGGGILRDIMAGKTPFVFVKHFYASASLIGAIICAVLWRHTGEIIAMSAGFVVIFILRLLAAKFRWSLPKAK
ncbi:MAG: trimeric intracellular cation channel family protein [Lachnospiraceae bacterium]|jgi:uncharacterized membrane protein YeiH